MDARLEELRRQLNQKTTEIESLLAAERGMGSIEDMDSAGYERLQEDVEERLERWEQASQGKSGNLDNTPLNRLIAERFEIEQEILAAKGEDLGQEVEGEDAESEEMQDEASADDWD